MKKIHIVLAIFIGLGIHQTKGQEILNSGFEDEPGLKNIESLKQFIKELRD